jgi:hypothetical protein
MEYFNGHNRFERKTVIFLIPLGESQTKFKSIMKYPNRQPEFEQFDLNVKQLKDL